MHIKHFFIINAYIYIMHSFVKFLFSSDNKTKLLKIQLQLNFGKSLLEQCSYQNVSWNYVRKCNTTFLTLTFG